MNSAALRNPRWFPFSIWQCNDLDYLCLLPLPSFSQKLSGSSMMWRRKMEIYFAFYGFSLSLKVLKAWKLKWLCVSSMSLIIVINATLWTSTASEEMLRKPLNTIFEFSRSTEYGWKECSKMSNLKTFFLIPNPRLFLPHSRRGISDFRPFEMIKKFLKDSVLFAGLIEFFSLFDGGKDSFSSESFYQLNRKS